MAFVTPLLGPGGAERQMLMLAASLPRTMFDVGFLLLAERGSLASEAESLGIAVDVLGQRRVRRRGGVLSVAVDSTRALGRYLRLTRSVDVVDAWLLPAYTFAGLAQPFARVPVLLAGRRALLDVYRSRSLYRDRGAALAMRNVHAVVANSHAAAKQAVIEEGIPRERVHVIHNAVTTVPTPGTQRRELRELWGFSDVNIVVGCVGNFRTGKGHDMMLDLAERLRDVHTGIRYVLVGTGPLQAWLEQEISRRALGGIVVLHTGEEDARRIYCGFDMHVQASDSEGLPNAVLEAASVGLAMVATDVGGTREVITTEVDGILVARRDGVALAAAVARLANDPELRQRFGTAARSRALDFSVDRLVANTATVYLRSLAEVSK